MPPIIQVTFNPAIWSAGSGAGTAPGDNGYNAANVWLDKDGTTAWAFEFFGGGFARIQLSNGAVLHQDTINGVPSGTGLLWYSRESVGSIFQQDSFGNYYAIPNAPFAPQWPTLYKFQIGAGTAGNLLNGYCTDPTTFNLQSMTPTPPGNTPFEDVRVFTSGGTTYLALIQENSGGAFYIVNVSTMTFVGSYSAAGQRGWVVFQDNAGDIWGGFQVGFGGDYSLVKWHPADGATGGALNFTTLGTGPHTVTQASLSPEFVGSGFLFASYVPATNSLWIGASTTETGPAANINLTTFAVNSKHADDSAYFENGILDNAQSACDNGVVGGILAIPADQAGETTQIGGIVNLIDPTANTIITNFNATTAIVGQGGLTPPPFDHGSVYATTCTQQWNGSQLVIAYQFIGSPVYILPLAGVSVPTVTTQAETGIGTTTGTANGNITNLGGAANCTLEGFVFDTVTHSLPGNVAPGSSGYLHNVTSLGTFSTGPYSIGMTGLTAGTTYFVRAVAQNSAGYSYGNEISFTTVPILNNATVLLVSSKAPSSFEDEVTFTATVSDPIVGDPNPNTPPAGTVQFVADGTFGFGSGTLTPLSAAIHAISATATVATYIGANSFSAGQKVFISGFGGGFTQFNQSGGVGNHGVVIASAGANSFTVNGTYTLQAQVNQDGTATSTSASQVAATTTVLIPGLHSIVAHYLGDPTPTTGHNPANSNTLTQQVVNVPTNTTQELPGFGLIASFSTQGDNALPPQAQLFAIPVNASSHQSINLLWNTLNVAFIRITGNNGVDYQPAGFDTGFVSTSGSGIYVVGNGFTATITLTLQGYDQTQTAIAGLVSQVLIHIS